MADNHSIQRQRLIFDSPKLATARAVESEARGWYYDSIQPTLESIFEEWSEEGELLCIDRLEIDLGTLDRNVFPAIVAERLRTALGTWKKERSLDAPPLLHQPGSPEWRTFMATGRLPEGRYTSLDRQWAALIYYLHHGRLPWPAGMQTQEPAPAFFTTLSGDRRAALKQMLPLRSVCIRLIAWLPDEVLAELVGVLSAESPSAKTIRRLNREQAQALSPWPDLAPLVNRLFWHAFLSAAGGTALSEADLRANLRSEIRALDVEWSPVKRALIGLKKDIPVQAQAWTKVIDLFISTRGKENGIYKKKGGVSLSSDGNERPATAKRSTESAVPPDEVVPTEGKVPQPGTATTEASAAATASSPTLTPGEALFVDNGGLVLLHPFFSTLFTDRGWWTKDGWRSEADRERAVYLLAYLASGEKNNPEFGCTLPKLLAGWPLDRPLSLSPQPREEDCAAAEELLVAAIRHWGALGNTSGDALREGFLRRNARLEAKDNGYRLTVERKTMDILLNRLPWGIGLIRLPWMEEILSVDWT